MKLSVAMATCNGARHLKAQLDSLLAQTRRPDELVVTDDRSDDDTPAIVNRFAADAPFPVVIRRNPVRLGYVGNFQHAVGLATGDVIFLCDQDDVWHPDKLARHEAAYRARPEAGAVIGDAAIVDQDLAPLGYTLWRHMGLHPRRVEKFRTGRGLDLYIKRGFCYGILLSFRAEYRDVLLPFPPDFSHDDWITVVLSAITQIELVDEPLIDYRQHRDQLIGVGVVAKPAAPPITSGATPGAAPTAPAAGNPFSHDLALQRVDVFEERMRRFSGRWIRPDVLRVIRGRRAYLERRRTMPGRGPVSRLLVVARELASGSYVRYASFPKTDLIADLRGR